MKLLAKIFIDTNIFLDFYRSNNESLKIFEELNKYAESLIFPIQVFNEFRRNRISLLIDLEKTGKTIPK